MKRDFNIFNILNSIVDGNYSLIDSLSESELKDFSPYVIQLWLDGADNNNDIRTVLMNELCNPYVFSLQNNKKLLYKLFCVANGFQIRTNFKFKKRKGICKHITSINIVMKYYGYNQNKAKDALILLSTDDIIELAEKLGYELNEINKIKKELKDV